MKVYGGMETYLDSFLNSVLGMTSGHFHATPPLTRGKSPHFWLHLKVSGPQFREGMNLLSVKGFESRFFGLQLESYSLYLLSYDGSQIHHVGLTGNIN